MKKCLLIIIVFTLVSPVIADKKPTVSELLSKFADNRDRLKSYIITEELETIFNAKTTNAQFLPYNGTWKRYHTNEVRTDGDRFYKESLWWGDDQRNRRFIPKKEGCYNSRLFDGIKSYAYSCWFDPAKPAGTLHIASGVNAIHKQEVLRRGLLGRQAFGVFDGCLNTRIDTILKNAKRIEVAEKPEEVCGVSCWIIKANTSHGNFKLWIAPERDYSIVKATTNAKAGDICNGSVRSENTRHTSTFEVIRFKQISGLWLPMEVLFKGKTNFQNGDYSQAENLYKITSISINPDHDKLDSFEVDDKIRNGAKVYTEQRSSEPDYIWQDGEPVPNEILSKSTSTETDNH